MLLLACFGQIAGGQTGAGRYSFPICRGTSGVNRCVAGS